MKRISRRPGIELLEICGEYLLVATEEARDTCPYVTQINKAAAVYWKLLDQAYTVNEFVENASLSLEKSKNSVFLPILAFINKLSKSGYIVEEEIN